MERKITIGQFEFVQKVVCRDLTKLLVFEYYDLSGHGHEAITIKEEDVHRDVLEYKPEFNAEYTITDLPDDLFEQLIKSDGLYLLKEWLKMNYEAILITEVTQ